MVSQLYHPKTVRAVEWHHSVEGLIQHPQPEGRVLCFFDYLGHAFEFWLGFGPNRIGLSLPSAALRKVFKLENIFGSYEK